MHCLRFHIGVAVLWLAAFLIVPAQAFAESASTGLTGWGELRTPDTVGAGKSEAYLGVRYNLINDNIGTRLQPTAGYVQGIGEWMEAGIAVPFRLVDGDSSLARIPVQYKLRFLTSDLFNFSGTAGIELPTASKDKNFGTGTLGFSGEIDGLLKLGSWGLAGSVNYGKSDYCPRCEYPGVQRGRTPVIIPQLHAAAGVGYAADVYRAYTELHFTNAANGDSAGTIPGDADLYFLVGGRYSGLSPVSLGGYAGAGAASNRSNTKVMGALLVHYTFGEEAPGEVPAEQPKAAPAAKAKPVVEIVDACNVADDVRGTMSLLTSKGFDARDGGKSPKKFEDTSVYFTDASLTVGSEIARLLPGKQKMYKQPSLPGSAAVRVFLGCDVAKPATPAVAKKPKAAINVAVVNGCGKPGLAEEAAKHLLLGGYNVTKIYDEPKQTTPGQTEVRFRAEYEAEAGDVAAKLPGRQRLFVERTLPADTDINVTVGCAQ